MNVLKLNHLDDLKSIDKKMANGSALVLSKDNLVIGIKNYKHKHVKKYVYVISSREEMVDFLSFLDKEYDIQNHYTTSDFKKFLKNIYLICKAHDRWSLLTVIK